MTQEVNPDAASNDKQATKKRKVRLSEEDKFGMEFYQGLLNFK